ncbi:hypothetical protein UFOVP286_70 [uncultured Caudovirales phage]|uniref:Uncharacterized protein n=1 Tax=uncultured Caudovirales phage TaxID=2100421 RepID=A0A6J5LN26_9CAUD|nr:hypothetical protein UFOVP286_70 [uncultured Caudovirales phage]
MKKLIKKLFTREKPLQTQEAKIYKSLNAAILTDIINQSNISGNTESNNNNK